MLSYPIRTAGCPIVNIGRFEPQVKYKDCSRRPKGEWDLVPGGWKISHSTSEKQAMAPAQQAGSWLLAGGGPSRCLISRTGEVVQAWVEPLADCEVAKTLTVEADGFALQLIRQGQEYLFAGEGVP